MTFVEDLKTKIGEMVYRRLENLADEEVRLAKDMPLIEASTHTEKYYRQRSLLEEVASECEIFENASLKFSPLDVINILFKCKLLFVCKDEKEYHQRVGGHSLVSEIEFIIRWEEKKFSIDTVIEKYLSNKHTFIHERILVSPISNFDSQSSNVKNFFEDVFTSVSPNFLVFLDDADLIKSHRQMEPGMLDVFYTPEEAKKFFSSPSIGFKSTGTYLYAYSYATCWLRTFLNILRISGYIYPYQMDYYRPNMSYMAPTAPVFLGDHSEGGFCWNEDAKKPWIKIPDGSLFLSFGFRGLAFMYLDDRTFKSHLTFFQNSKIIFEYVKNPYSKKCLNDIFPTIDILSSATQIQDLGAKLLLIYCCLEHLFVPASVRTDNKKYIVGGINALDAGMLTWFEELYKLRCEFAHKGFVIKDYRLVELVNVSLKNAFGLLIAKLETSRS